MWKMALVQEIWGSQQGIKGKQIIKEWLIPTAIPMQSTKWHIIINSLCHMAHTEAAGLEFKPDEFWLLLTPKCSGLVTFVQVSGRLLCGTAQVFIKKRHDNFFCCVSTQVFLPVSRQRQAAKNLSVKSYRHCSTWGYFKVLSATLCKWRCGSDDTQELKLCLKSPQI